MQKQTLNIDNKNVVVTSKDATGPFNLHDIDIEFIEQDIQEESANNGEMKVMVDEGIINIAWIVEVAPIKRLSKRELAILEGYKKGLKNKNIAQELGIEQKTVGTYVARAKKKLGLSNDDNVYLTVNTAIQKGVI